MPKSDVRKVAGGNMRWVGHDLTLADLALLRELVRYAIEEIGFTIETAQQRRHVPEGLRAYRAEATTLLKRLQ